MLSSTARTLLEIGSSSTGGNQNNGQGIDIPTAWSLVLIIVGLVVFWQRCRNANNGLQPQGAPQDSDASAQYQRESQSQDVEYAILVDDQPVDLRQGSLASIGCCGP